MKRTLLLLTQVLWMASATAAILPYRTRARDFSSWTPATRGDTNTIGMAGATLAVPTSISAAEANPAGFAMATGSVSAQINKVSLLDRRLQRSGEPVDSSQWGLAVSPDRWGLSIAYYSPETESGTYVSPNTGDTVKTEVSMKELRLTIARALLDDSFAIGLSLEAVKAVRELDEASANALGTSYRLGALYRFPEHVLVGAVYAPRISVGPSGDPDAQSVIPGFNRAVVRPQQVGLGVGWIPNRFFKTGASLTYVGRTENTALLADQSVTTGAVPTWVPRVGASYVLGEFRNFKMEAAVGSYFETSRLSDRSNRLHVTAGLEANPYFINLGTGFDFSADFRNVIVSVGLDIVRTARAFDIIPREPVPPSDRMWPKPLEVSADGLPDGLVGRDEQRDYQPPTVEQVKKIVSDVPENIAKKVSGEKTTVEEKEKTPRRSKRKRSAKKP